MYSRLQKGVRFSRHFKKKKFFEHKQEISNNDNVNIWLYKR